MRLRLALLLPCLAALVAAEPAAEPVALRVGLEWFLNPDHLPLVVALREGYFAEAGLAVELVEPRDHWEADDEILAGRLDVAVTEPLHLALDAARGKAVIGFSRFLHTDGGVMYVRGRNITRPRDMCGATISYPGAPGPGGPAIVQTMIEADGGGPCAEPFGKHAGGFYHTDALASGAADVATLAFYNFEVVEARGRGLDVDFFSLKDFGVPCFCQLVLFTTPQRLEALADPLRKLVLAMRRATGLIKQDPKRARAIWREHAAPKRTLAGRLDIRTWIKRAREARADRATFEASLPAFVNDNSLALEYFEALNDWLVKTDQVDAAAARPVAEYWTNALAL